MSGADLPFGGLTDLHNHLLAGVDDGARSAEESECGLAALARDGVRRLVVTPHLSAELTVRDDALEARLAELDAAWVAFSGVTGREVEVALHRGAEIMLDTPEPDFSDSRVRLAGGSYVLIEFPHAMIPPHVNHVLARIAAKGIVPLIAHPERYPQIAGDPEVPLTWRDHGARLQVNAGSLLGWYGSRAREAAWMLLEHGLADTMASDYHARGRSPLPAALEVLAEAGADGQAELLLRDNPERIVHDRRLEPAERLVRPRRTLWNRLVRR